MAKLGEFKRLVREDFSGDDQALVEKLAFTINPALESISQALNKNLTFEDNINSQIRDIEVKTHPSVLGRLSPSVSYKSTLKGNTKGLVCIRAENIDNPSTYPTGQPFISYSENNGQISILNVTGLQLNSKYKLKILAIG